MIRPIPHSDPLDLEPFREVITASGKKKEIHTDTWKRCVDHVKAKGSGVSPYAVCTASLGHSKTFLK